MSTTVLRVVKCDRCKKTEEAPTVTSMPEGWVQLTDNHAGTKHLCFDCRKRALKV